MKITDAKLLHELYEKSVNRPGGDPFGVISESGNGIGILRI